MKNIFIAINAMVLLLCGCTASKFPITTPEVNTRVKDERVTEMLLGHCSRSCLLEAPYKDWFLKNYNEYVVDTGVANKIKTLLTGKTLVVFMGTWCGDSKREVPRLIKILDYCEFKDEGLKLVMVDYRDGVYKQSPQHEERGKNIFRVPTILIYSGNEELGRIIEFPRQTLEKDLLSVLTKEGYVPNYEAGDQFIREIKKSPARHLNGDSLRYSNSLRPVLRNSFELNSIGHVLLGQGEEKKSLFVFSLNKDLYPTSATAWNGLATINMKLRRANDARAAIEKALTIDSTNAESKRLFQLIQ